MEKRWTIFKAASIIFLAMTAVVLTFIGIGFYFLSRNTYEYNFSPHLLLASFVFTCLIVYGIFCLHLLAQRNAVKPLSKVQQTLLIFFAVLNIIVAAALTAIFCYGLFETIKDPDQEDYQTGIYILIFLALYIPVQVYLFIYSLKLRRLIKDKVREQNSFLVDEIGS